MIDENLMATYRDHFAVDQPLEDRLEAFRGRKTLKILITGSRLWLYPDIVETALDIVHAAARVKKRRMVVREGGCKKGPDTISRNWAIGHGGLQTPKTPDMVLLDTWPAAWTGSDRGAGMRRNQDMVDGGADACLAFIRDRSPGASHCAERAEAAGIPTIRWADIDGQLHWPQPGWGHLIPV